MPEGATRYRASENIPTDDLIRSILRHIKKTPPLPERQGGVRKGNEWDKEQGGSAGICLPAVCYPVVPAHHARACDAALHETVPAAALPAFNFPVADRSRQAVF